MKRVLMTSFSINEWGGTFFCTKPTHFLEKGSVFFHFSTFKKIFWKILAQHFSSTLSLP